MLRRIVLGVSAAALLAGCGTASFSNAVAVVVPAAQRVGVFDPQMGQSADWAGKTMGQAAPGAPYTTQVPATDTKVIGDSSPPTSVNLGVYLPDRTQTGYYSLSLPDAEEGTRDMTLPYVAWYSEQPVDPLPGLPATVELAAGPNGWLVTITVAS